MELYNNNSYLHEKSESDTIMGRALMSGRLAAALFFSAAMHASLLWMNMYDSKQIGSPNLFVKTIGFNAHINDADVSTLGSDREIQKEAVLHGSNNTNSLSQERFVAAEPPPRSNDAVQMPVDDVVVQESSESIKGMMVGPAGFTGFGGSRRRPFEVVGAVDPRIQNSNGDTDHSMARRQIAQTVVAEMKNELNQLMPADAGQVCQLQVSVACYKRNDALERYLLSKAPMLQQLVGGKAVRVASEDGLWKIEISN